MNSYGMGSSSSGSFPLVLTKWASLGGAGWRFSWTQVPFSLASLFFWSFSFTCFRTREMAQSVKAFAIKPDRVWSLGVTWCKWTPMSCSLTSQCVPWHTHTCATTHTCTQTQSMDHQSINNLLVIITLSQRSSWGCGAGKVPAREGNGSARCALLCGAVS